MNTIRKSALSAALISLLSTAALAAPHCYTSYGGTKPNKLYLYFPNAADPTYPSSASLSVRRPPHHCTPSRSATCPATPELCPH